MNFLNRSAVSKGSCLVTHPQGKRFNSSLMGMLFMCSSLPVGRVIESGMPAGAEWQPWGPQDQCFDNKCPLLFGPGAWCLLCCFYCPLGPAWLPAVSENSTEREVDKSTDRVPSVNFLKQHWHSMSKSLETPSSNERHFSTPCIVFLLVVWNDWIVSMAGVRGSFLARMSVCNYQMHLVHFGFHKQWKVFFYWLHNYCSFYNFQHCSGPITWCHRWSCLTAVS